MKSITERLVEKCITTRKLKQGDRTRHLYEFDIETLVNVVEELINDNWMKGLQEFRKKLMFWKLRRTNNERRI